GQVGRGVGDARGLVEVGEVAGDRGGVGEGAVGGLHREHEARGGLKVEHARVGDRDLAGGAVDRKAAQGVAGGDRVGERGAVDIGVGAADDVVDVVDVGAVGAVLGQARSGEGGVGGGGGVGGVDGDRGGGCEGGVGEGAVGGMHREDEGRCGVKVEHARVGDRDLAGGAVDRKAAQGVAGGDRVGERGAVDIGVGAADDVVDVVDVGAVGAVLGQA